MAELPTRRSSESLTLEAVPDVVDNLVTSPEGLKDVEKDSGLTTSSKPKELKELDEEWERDLDNPRNWTSKKKWGSMAVVALYTFFSPLTSSMMAPGLAEVALQYGITNPTIINLTLSIFLISFAIGPLVWAPLSEMYGRTWPLHLASIGTIAFNLGCAFSPDTATLLVMRFFAGFFAASPVAIGGGSVSDLFAPHERASAMALYSLGPLMGPVVGPIAGGYIAQYIGIKWVFIIISVGAGVSLLAGICLLRETYGPVIRLRKAKREGKLEELLAANPQAAAAQSGKANLIAENMVRPTVLLFRSSILFMLSLYMAYLYGVYYLMFATFGQLFAEVYGFKPGVGGLVYLGLGVGFMLATIIGSKTADQVYHRLGERNGGVSTPEHRLPALILGSLFVPIGLFWYGWSADAKLHWIMPIIGSGIFGFAQMTIFLPVTLYIVDAFAYAASANSAAAVLRSILGFAFPLFAQQMFDALGLGPGNSLLAGISIVLGIPFPIWLYFKGEELRKKNKYTR